MPQASRSFPFAVLALVAVALGGCGSFPAGAPSASLSERDCLARAMYFESNRSSEDGMAAVGTVVMNRVQSPRYPKSVCGVVGQPSQFAEGALSKPVGTRSWALAQRVADEVLDGRRHGGVGAAMHFHTVGYTFPYRNMRYVTLAGGNIFYDKRYPEPGAPAWPSATAFARRATPAASEPKPTLLAAAEPTAATPRPRTEPAASKPAVVIAAVAPTRSPRPSESRSALPASAAAKPKPIVLAMATAKPSGKPRSIADLIESLD